MGSDENEGGNWTNWRTAYKAHKNGITGETVKLRVKKNRQKKAQIWVKIENHSRKSKLNLKQENNLSTLFSLFL